VKSNPFDDSFLRLNSENFGRRFKCKVCGFEFVWGDDDIDFCEHLRDKQPLQLLHKGLIEKIKD